MIPTCRCSLRHLLPVFFVIGCLMLSPAESQNNGPCNPPPVCTPGQRLPNIDNCRTYFLCNNRNEWAREACASGEFFNQRLLECRGDPTTDCQTECPTPPAGVVTSGEKNIGGNCVVQLPCNPAQTPYFADPSDCSKYYQCEASGLVMEQDCDNLFWHPQQQTCVGRRDQNCQRGCPPGSTEATPRTADVGPDCVVDLPCNPGDEFAYPGQCRKKFTCTNSGELQEEDCRGNQLFDVGSRRCTGRGRAVCHTGNDCPTGTRRRQQTVVTTTTASAADVNPLRMTSGTVVLGSSCEVDLPCGQVFPTGVQFVGNLDDCSKYFECERTTGAVTEHTCSGSEWFNVAAQRCSGRSRPQCQEQVGCPAWARDQNAGTTTTERAPPLAPLQTNVCNRENIQCSAGQYVADPDDCRKYYICMTIGSNSQWTHRTCPDSDPFYHALTTKCTDRSRARCHPPCTTSTVAAATTTTTTTTALPTTTTAATTTTASAAAATTTTTTTTAAATTSTEMTTTTHAPPPVQTSTTVRPAETTTTTAAAPSTTTTAPTTTTTTTPGRTTTTSEPTTTTTTVAPTESKIETTTTGQLVTTSTTTTVASPELVSTTTASRTTTTPARTTTQMESISTTEEPLGTSSSTRSAAGSQPGTQPAPTDPVRFVTTTSGPQTANNQTVASPDPNDEKDSGTTPGPSDKDSALTNAPDTVTDKQPMPTPVVSDGPPSPSEFVSPSESASMSLTSNSDTNSSSSASLTRSNSVVMTVDIPDDPSVEIIPDSKLSQMIESSADNTTQGASPHVAATTTVADDTQIMTPAPGAGQTTTTSSPQTPVSQISPDESKSTIRSTPTENVATVQPTQSVNVTGRVPVRDQSDSGSDDLMSPSQSQAPSARDSSTAHPNLESITAANNEPGNTHSDVSRSGDLNEFVTSPSFPEQTESAVIESSQTSSYEAVSDSLPSSSGPRFSDFPGDSATTPVVIDASESTGSVDPEDTSLDATAADASSPRPTLDSSMSQTEGTESTEVTESVTGQTDGVSNEITEVTSFAIGSTEVTPSDSSSSRTDSVSDHTDNTVSAETTSIADTTEATPSDSSSLGTESMDSVSDQTVSTVMTESASDTTEATSVTDTSTEVTSSDSSSLGTSLTVDLSTDVSTDSTDSTDSTMSTETTDQTTVSDMPSSQDWTASSDGTTSFDSSTGPWSSTDLTTPDTTDLTDGTSLSPSDLSTTLSTDSSPEAELTASTVSGAAAEATTPLIPSSTVTVSEEEEELTAATNDPNSVVASASVEAGGVLGNDTTDSMRASVDHDSTTTPGIGAPVTETIFCEPNAADGVSWEKTAVGQADTKPCPDGRKGTASRSCASGSVAGEGRWLDPDLSLCADAQYTQLLDGLGADPSPSDRRNLTRGLRALAEEASRQPGGITPGNLDASVEALGLLVGSGENEELSPKEAESILETASTLLSPNNTGAWDSVLTEDEGKAVALLSTMDEFGHLVAMMATPGEPTIIRAENIAIEARSIPRGTEERVVFSATPRDKKSRPRARGVNRQGVVLEAETIEHLSEDLRQENLVIWSSHYTTLSALLPSSGDALINSDIISLTVDKLPEGSKLDPDVKLRFSLENTTWTEYKPVCSFWKYTGAETGEWSSEGCTTVQSNETGVFCECNHLTNFAVLMSPYVAEGRHAEILGLISTIGCLLSIVGCTITICLYLLCWKRIKSHHAAVLLNLCAILIIGNVLFLVGIDRTENEMLCTGIAVGMHYIWLVAFFIMLADGIEFILYVVYVFHVKRRTETFLLLFTCYIVPAIVVAIAASVTMLEGYGTDKYCWLSWENGVVSAFIIPVVVIIVVNLCFLLKILCTVGKSEGVRQSDRHRARATIWNIAVILPLLGITWLFGLFSVDKHTLVFQYLFAICNSLQGFAIFIFHCILNQKLREAVGQRFSSSWSSTASYKSTKSNKSNKSNRSDQLVKKMIKNDKRRETKNGAMNNGFSPHDLERNSKEQVYISHNGRAEPESPTDKTRLRLQSDSSGGGGGGGGGRPHSNGVTRYSNGSLHGSLHGFHRQPSREDSFASTKEPHIYLEDNASTYIVLEPDVVRIGDPEYQADKAFGNGSSQSFNRNSGSEDYDSQIESDSM